MRSANLFGPLKGLCPHKALIGLTQASGLAGGFDSMRFCAARTARGRGGDQPSRPAFRASTVRRSSSRLARQVSSFFRAVVRSTSAERSSAFSCAVELNLRESGTCFPRKWSSALEIYKIIRGTEGNILCLKNIISK